MHHIAIVCSRLDLPAGIERAIVTASNLFVSKGNKVSILILDETSKVFFPLDASVSIYHCELNFGITTKGNIVSRKLFFFNHLQILKARFKELSPDIVITTEYPFTIAAGLIKKRTYKLFSWEHHHFYHLKRNRFWNLLLKKVYPQIDRIICLNPEEASFFEQIGCRTAVIPNFIIFSGKEKASLINKQILTAGWLTKTKGSDFIPAISKKIFQKHPGWLWKIFGDGEEKKSLSKISHSLIISAPITAIEEEYKNSSIYVLPSRMECFPMVLLEAMSFGVPCVAFDCPTGPRHIIKNGEDGILVEKENMEAMADAIIDLIENEEKRKRMGANSFKNIQRFSPETIYQLWENLFNTKTSSTHGPE